MHSNTLTYFFEVIDFQSNTCTYACLLQLFGILFKKNVNVFGRMDITESIYVGTVEPSYKNYWGRCQPCCTYQAK